MSDPTETRHTFVPGQQKCVSGCEGCGIDRAQWSSLIEQVNELHGRLQKKPARLKLGYRLHPGGILNAYREGDISFDDAVSKLALRTPAQGQPEPPQASVDRDTADVLDSIVAVLRDKAEHLDSIAESFRLAADPEAIRLIALAASTVIPRPAIQPVTPPSECELFADVQRSVLRYWKARHLEHEDVDEIMAIIEKRAAPLGEQPRPHPQLELLHRDICEIQNTDESEQVFYLVRAMRILVEHLMRASLLTAEQDSGESQAEVAPKEEKFPAPADLPQAIAREIQKEFLNGDWRRVSKTELETEAIPDLAALIATALAPLVAERDALRAKNQELNRRCQSLESALRNTEDYRQWHGYFKATLKILGDEEVKLTAAESELNSLRGAGWIDPEKELPTEDQWCVLNHAKWEQPMFAHFFTPRKWFVGMSQPYPGLYWLKLPILGRASSSGETGRGQDGK